jgi:transcriptional regulator GlxA family with amidase domain
VGDKVQKRTRRALQIFAFCVPALRFLYRPPDTARQKSAPKQALTGTENRVPWLHTTMPAERSADSRRVRQVEAFFRARAKQAVTLSEAAACAGCSVRALQLAFRRCCGSTPMAALRRIRLEAAREALAGASRAASVRAIAAEHGFTNPGRFARLFKEAFGQSPAELRRVSEDR